MAIFVNILAWTLLLLGGILLPFIPGAYDPLAATLSVSATTMAFGSLLVVPVGLMWLLTGREYASAKGALIIATLLTVGVALATAAGGSLTAAAAMFATAIAWAARLWRRAGAAQRIGAHLPRAVPTAVITIPLVMIGARWTLAEPAAAWSRDRVIGNAVPMIADIERFRERTGAYPVAISSVHPDYLPGVLGVERYRYEPSGEAYNLYFEHPSPTLGVQEIVMYNPRGEQDISSHAIDLLQLSPEDIRRQRGYFTTQELRQSGWRRFLFD